MNCDLKHLTNTSDISAGEQERALTAWSAKQMHSNRDNHLPRGPRAPVTAAALFQK